jgi:signal peptidase I
MAVVDILKGSRLWLLDAVCSDSQYLFFMAKKRKKKQPFGGAGGSASVSSAAVGRATFDADRQGGVFNFFRDFGVRETIESVIVAIILAMLFRGFEAEAFIIPTGSMAPSLQGQHMDLECGHCQYRYRTGASRSGSSFNNQAQVASTFCPICQFETEMRARKVADHRSNNGDRILVNKFVYDAQPPKRYDVIVFKNPNNGKQNYIKRLVGMPGDNLLIENGDIYTMETVGESSDKWTKSITRKPHDSLLAVLQVVDDTDYIGPQLQAVNWPSRWNTWREDVQVDLQTTQGVPAFHFDAAENPEMIRYRHLVPLKDEWDLIEQKKLPPRLSGDQFPKGRLINDYYAYNDRVYLYKQGAERRLVPELSRGLHWVGDIGLEASVQVVSAGGMLILDLVEGGAHFRCEIDTQTGKATLSCDDPEVQFVDGDGKTVDQPTAQTTVTGAGTYDIRYVNADDRLNLWIDDQLVEIDAAAYLRDEVPIPTWSSEDAGDAEPLGIGFANGKMTVNRLAVLRDVYYTSVQGRRNSGMLGNETNSTPSDIERLQRMPEKWDDPAAVAYFKTKKQHDKPMFVLQDFEDDRLDQFLPCGDNSPYSLDGRVWNGPNFVSREMLIGRAMFIYWPHTKNKPLPFFPNFESMKFIR